MNIPSVFIEGATRINHPLSFSCEPSTSLLFVFWPFYVHQFFPLSLRVHLIFLRELGQDFVLHHVGHLLVAALIYFLVKAFLPLSSALQEVLKVGMRVWVEEVEPEGSFALHCLIFILTVLAVLTV